MAAVRCWAFDPYEDARPIGRCPNCGEPIYEGDDYYYVTRPARTYWSAAKTARADGRPAPWDRRTIWN